jgi:hypothetical protein
MILIGIDPAFRENGFAAAIYDPADTTEPLRFIVFRNVLGFIGWVQNDAPASAFVTVEHSNLDQAVYHLGPRMNARQAAAVGLRVGKNQAISQLAVDLFRAKYGHTSVNDVAPNKKGGAVYERRIALVDVYELTGAKATDRVADALKSEDCRSALMMLMRAKANYRLAKALKVVSL